MKLELPGGDLDPVVVQGWMLFPNDPAVRDLHLARRQLAGEIDRISPDEAVSVPARVLETVLAGPGRAEFQGMASDATKKGVVAGDLLTLMCERHFSGLAASKEKAIAHYKVWALGKKYGDKRPLPYSRATLLAHFDEFQSVAHLWAAYRVNEFSESPLDVWRTRSGLRHLLGLAKAFGHFAANLTPPHTRLPVPVIPSPMQVFLPDDVPAVPLPWVP